MRRERASELLRQACLHVCGGCLLGKTAFSPEKAEHFSIVTAQLMCALNSFSQAELSEEDAEEMKRGQQQKPWSLTAPGAQHVKEETACL